MPQANPRPTAIAAPKKLPPRPKALRADLQKLFDDLTATGWKISLGDGIWVGEIILRNGNPYTVGNEKISVLLAQLKALNNDENFNKPLPPLVTVSSADPNTVVAIETSRLLPSPSEPQSRRRRHFTDEDIEELGNSIEQDGLLSPIIVRPVGEHLEIVIGERRWLATKRKNIRTINCFVRPVSDEVALKLQIQENLQRKDIHPLDEAFDYKFYLERTGHSVEEMALEFGKSEQYIYRRLRLTELIPEAVEMVTSGILRIGHALAIAALPPDSQKIIVEENLIYHKQDPSDKLLSLSEFRWCLEIHVARLLRSAPFDTEDPRLRVDGLICSNCTERTGFAPALFADDFDAEDRCLNKTCYKAKTENSQLVQRAEIAAGVPDEPSQLLAFADTRQKTSADKTSPAEISPAVQKLYDAPQCEYAVLSPVEVFGQPAYVCVDNRCRIHQQNDHPAAASSEFDLQKKQEDFERQVAARISQKVFASALEFFTDYNPVWKFDDLIRQLLASFWWISPPEHKQFLCEQVKDWSDAPTPRSHYWDVKRFVETLDKRRQSQLLFLLIHAGNNAALYHATSEYFAVRKIATDYTKLDYQILDAEARLYLAPAEFKPIAEAYLNDVRIGIPAEIPAFWWESGEEESGDGDLVVE